MRNERNAGVLARYVESRLRQPANTNGILGAAEDLSGTKKLTVSYSLPSYEKEGKENGNS